MLTQGHGNTANQEHLSVGEKTLLADGGRAQLNTHTGWRQMEDMPRLRLRPRRGHWLQRMGRSQPVGEQTGMMKCVCMLALYSDCP